jgi:hypothetical protein
MGKISSDNVYEATNDFHNKGSGVRALRAKTIEFLFAHIYNSPLKSKWKELCLIPTIIRDLQISDNSFSRVSAMLEAILKDQTKCETTIGSTRSKRPYY